MKIKGLDQLSNRLSKIAENAKNLNGPHDVPMSELFNGAFMAAHSKFASIDEFFEAGGFDTSDPGFIERISREQLDSFVLTQTSFGTWSEMVQSAGGKWAKAQIFR